jgi:hypothetical protein
MFDDPAFYRQRAALVAEHGYTAVTAAAISASVAATQP